MERTKLNDKCTFPNVLNMKPYTYESIYKKELMPDNYYDYDLVGCVIHAGTAVSGHYFSLIRTGESNDD